MSRQAMIISLLVLIGLSLVAIALLLQPGRGGATDSAASLQLKPAEIKGLVVRPAEGDATSVWREPSRGWRHVEGDSRPSEQIQGWPVAPTRIQGLVRVLNELRFQSGVEFDATGEAATLTVHMDDGEIITLLAPRARVGGSSRVFVEGLGVALTGEPIHDALVNPGPSAWRSRSALPGVGADAGRITLETAGATIRLHKAEGVWRLLAPFPARADQDAVRNLLARLIELRVASFLDEPREIADPMVTVRVETDRRDVDETGEVSIESDARTLLIGDAADVAGDARFATSGETGLSFLIESALIDSIPLNPSKLVAQSAAASAPESVGMVVLEFERRDVGYRRGVDGWRRLGASTADADADERADRLQRLLTLLHSAEAREVSIGQAPGSGIGSVELLGFDAGLLERIGVELTADDAIVLVERQGAGPTIRRSYGAETSEALLRLFDALIDAKVEPISSAG